MKLIARIPVAAALLVLTLSATGCNKLKARDELTKGVQAFKNARFEEAVTHFQSSIALDPTYETPKLYLATAYASQVVPNSDSPDNLKVAQKAMDSFQQVLNKDPNDLAALRQMASINRNIKKQDVAKDYEKKVIAQDPNDAEANYTIGAVDWKLAYDNAVNLLATEKLIDDGNGNLKKSKNLCTALQAKNGALVDEGLQFLNRAVVINPSYEEAMEFLSLMERRKADLECGNDVARKADLDKSDEWAKRSMGARKENELKKEKKAGGGVQM